MKKKYSAFTLSEVLITLMILGVIAALTIPVLQDNVNKSAWTNGLKVAKGNIESAFANMMADYSTDALIDTPIFSDTSEGWVGYDPLYSSSNSGTKDWDLTGLQKYLKTDSVTNNVPYDTYNITGTKKIISDPGTRFDLANNISVNIYIDKTTFSIQDSSTAADCGNIICDEYAKVYIDVNGKKGPNTFGKDIYTFALSERGRLVPYGSKALNKLNNTPTWESTCAGRHPESGWDGEACTARVIDEGYKINYLK